MFQVEWRQGAVGELAAIWLCADSEKRRAITTATNTIDHGLQSDPFGQSESRADERRVLFAQPLGVVFKVDSEQRIAWVEHVWYYRPRKK